MLDVPEEVKDEISRLNKAVDDAIKNRAAYFDSKMAEFADVKIGEKAYDSDGNYLGVVTEYYRYQALHNPLYDTSLSISYRFDNGDNTSRRSIYYCYTKEQTAKMLARRAKTMMEMTT
jgi:hypothetical protein